MSRIPSIALEFREMSSGKPNPVFLDPTGRRWSRVRRAAFAVGIVTTLLAAVVVVGVLTPPVLPALSAAVRTSRNLTALPALAGSKRERARIAARRRVFAALDRHPVPAGVHPVHLPLPSPGHRGRSSRPTAPPNAEVAGFYVNWDDNSWASLRAHATEMDFVVGEWIFVAPGGDSLVRNIDRKVTTLVDHLPAEVRPRLLAMVSNYDAGTRLFDAARLRSLVGNRMTRERVIGQLAELVYRYGLAGVTLDFEGVPENLHPGLLRFAHELRAALAPMGALLTQAIGADMDDAHLRDFGAIDDRIFLMLYDEHYGKGDPGPIASQAWYVERARHVLHEVSPTKLILAVGAYGYDWNDADPKDSGAEMTFQDVMAVSMENGTPVRFDSVALNPYLRYTSADSTDHLVWFLDGVSAYNQILAGQSLGVAGSAIWRLGSEDPSVWRVIGRTGLDSPVDSLASIPEGYDVQFRGTGEILDIEAHPDTGHRSVHVDPTTRFVVDETVDRLPTPWIVHREGAGMPHRVALTFDDGPDGRWTPAILDTLKSRGVQATFFLIGRNIETNLALTRRIYREGHELGNHTFTHPNLAFTDDFVTRLELDGTERIIEAVTDRRSAYFRPPYFGDAEPTTNDELVPVSVATGLGYVTAGLHIDSEDWRESDPAVIVRNVLEQRHLGNVVLLHDGGGKRPATVAALGAIIDSLRARGDTLVVLSELVGVPRDVAMPTLPPSSAVTRSIELASYGLVGGVEWGLHWLFLLAVALGMSRLFFIFVLALVQRYRHRPRRADAAFAPGVSVIVPAYNEALVINRTIASLLAQEYAGFLEVVVVDDGSPDLTYQVARQEFGDHPRVSILTKPNGGKASALNFGITRARGEIVIGLDADTLFEPLTVARLIAPLADPSVGAVAGNAKVGNRLNLVTRWQALEYVTSQNLERRAFDMLNGITVVPGAVGAWRKALVDAAGGFSDDTLAEDQDLTLSIRRMGYHIAYADRAIAWTEAPDTFRGLAKQRFRWSFGTLQCAWKHRDTLFRPRYGTLGFVALPNTWLFQLLFTALSPLADLAFLWSLVSVWLVSQEHGQTYALNDLEQILTYYAIFLLVDWLAAMIAFLIEPGEDRRLTWLIVLQRFAYRQIMYWVVIKSFAAAIRGRVVGWGKLERKATVALPA